jgi:NAD(P)H-dependent FMN reductase
MTALIIGTNRHDALSAKIARQIMGIAEKVLGDKVHLIDLAEIDFQLDPRQYSEGQMSPDLRRIQDEIIEPADRFIFVFPEYNGSFPGVLKLFIDALSIRKYKESFDGKKSMSFGVATGRAGNLRGLDQFDHVLQHLGVHTFNKKVPLSQISRFMEGDEIVDPSTLKEIRSALTSYSEF